MNENQLAKSLRARQARMGHPKELITELSNEQIVQAYVECARCRAPLFSDAKAAVRNSNSVEEFLHFVNMALASHQCSNTPIQGVN